MAGPTLSDEDLNMKWVGSGLPLICRIVHIGTV